MRAEEYFRAIGLGDNDAAAAEERARHFATLYEIATAVQTEQDARTMLSRAMDVLLHVVGAERGSVAIGIVASGSHMPVAMS